LGQSSSSGTALYSSLGLDSLSRETSMPAKSKAHFRFMQGVKHGSIKVPGLSSKTASEFVAKTKNPKLLPERK
jgi:hypothetical protein